MVAPVSTLALAAIAYSRQGFFSSGASRMTIGSRGCSDSSGSGAML
jgi:hypothetical protein